VTGPAAPLGFTCFGVPFRLSVSGHAPLGAAIDCLPPGSLPAEPGDGAPCFSLQATGNAELVWRVEAPGASPIETADGEWALAALESRVRAHVAVSSPDHVFVHAGVVGWQGRTIVIPGASGTGKSTLVAAFVEAGAEYWSDEYAVFDGDGGLHPFRRPITLVEPGRTTKRRLPVPADGGHREDPQPLGAVLVLPYERDAVWHPVPLTPGDCALALLAHAVAGRVNSARVLRVLARAVAGAVGWRSPRSDIGPADPRQWQALLELVTSRT
jgi:hypothetical protein